MAADLAKPIILVDGSSYLYRAYHALPALTNSQGEPTGAIYGVVSMLRKLLRDYQPDCLAVVFDAPGKTFREDLYVDYKAHRPMMPVELQQQIEPIHALIKALGIPLLMIAGVEADDVIGTLAREAVAANRQLLISTCDKDLAQLVSEHVTLVNTMNGVELNPATVFAKFGVTPAQIVDYLALIGDPVDNIPGIPQVGPKTAAKWLQTWGTLETLIAHVETISGKVGENLRTHLSVLERNKTLVTIKQDVLLPVALAELTRGVANVETLKAWYQRLEFKTWLKELLEEKPALTANHYADYEIITDETSFYRWKEALVNCEYFAMDTETTSLDYMTAQLVGISIAVQPGQAAYIPVGHDYPDAPVQLSKDFILKELKPILEDPQRKKLGHNLKYDAEILANMGIELRGIAYDTMLESYLLESAGNNHNLDSLALKYLDWRTIHFEDVAGKGSKQLTFNQVPLAEASTYASEDADVCLRLHHILWPKLQMTGRLAKVYEELERPLLPVLARMERHGVLLDVPLLRAQSEDLAKRLAELEAETYRLAGTSFNVNSPKQLQEILFTQFKLPVLQKTATGQPSTAEAVLQELALDYPLPQVIIDYRSLNKLMTTYTNKLPEQVNNKTGRVHTSYHQAVTATGRLSSSDPNLQNIPVRTAEGRRIRQAFIASPGYQILSADYSQIELRIMAHLSEDVSLLTAFAANKDIHQATAAEVFGVPLATVTAEERRRAKAINFGLIYGMSAFGLAKQLGIERQQAQYYIDCYFARYPGIKAYMDKTRQLAHQQGYVETITGRRLYIPDIKSSQGQRQKAAERAAINAPLQGTAADIIKRAMIDIDAWLQASKLANMIMQVHDELVFEVADQHVEALKAGVALRMMQAAELKVPLTVSIGIGLNWDAASKVTTSL